MFLYVMNQCRIKTLVLSTCLLVIQQCVARSEGSCQAHAHCRSGSLIQFGAERRSQEYGDRVGVAQRREHASDKVDDVPVGLATDVAGMAELSSDHVAEQWRAGRTISDADMLRKFRSHTGGKKDDALDQLEALNRIEASLAETQGVVNSIANAYQEFVDHTSTDAQARGVIGNPLQLLQQDIPPQPMVMTLSPGNTSTTTTEVGGSTTSVNETAGNATNHLSRNFVAPSSRLAYMILALVLVTGYGQTLM